MRLLISGAGGLIGSALRQSLAGAGNEVVRLRHAPDLAPEDLAGQAAMGEVLWNWEAGAIDADRLDGFDAVVHLAGENVASGRWTAAKKARIRDSRVRGTRLLVDAIARLDRKPRVFLSASGINYYGDRGEEALDESSEPGNGFLAEVCRDWEAAAGPVAEAGVRLVTMRMGVVFSRQGGALAKMLPLFRMGLGGRLGSGRHYVSWVTLRDAVRAMRFFLDRETLDGPFILATPQPVTNRDLTGALARALRRPAFFPAPAPLLRLALGEMADEMLLASVRAFPRRLTEAGFLFKGAPLDRALARVLRRP